MAPLSSCQVRKPAGDLQSSQGTNHARRRKKQSHSWRVGTWNVCSMVYTEGPIAIASRRQNGQREVDRKVDLII